MTRASARRFLRTLVELGYVRSNGRLFALRPRVLELGYAYLSGLSLHEVAQPHLERLVEVLRESSSVSVLDADDVVYVAQSDTADHDHHDQRRHAVPRVCDVDGPRAACGTERRLAGRILRDRRTAPTHGTHGHGRPRAARGALLVREQGWAFVDEELEEGLRAIAAPINDASGRVIAAVNVSSPVSRGSADLVRGEFLPHLLAAARGIEEDLGHSATGSR